jgi:hypothetical protein
VVIVARDGQRAETAITSEAMELPWAAGVRKRRAAVIGVDVTETSGSSDSAAAAAVWTTDASSSSSMAEVVGGGLIVEKYSEAASEATEPTSVDNDGRGATETVSIGDARGGPVTAAPRMATTGIGVWQFKRDGVRIDLANDAAAETTTTRITPTTGTGSIETGDYGLSTNSPRGVTSSGVTGELTGHANRLSSVRRESSANGYTTATTTTPDINADNRMRTTERSIISTNSTDAIDLTTVENSRVSHEEFHRSANASNVGEVTDSSAAVTETIFALANETHITTPSRASKSAATLRHVASSSTDVTAERLNYLTTADGALFVDESFTMTPRENIGESPLTTAIATNSDGVQNRKDSSADRTFHAPPDDVTFRPLPAHEALRSVLEQNASSLSSSSSSSAAVGPSRPSASVSSSGLLREEVATVGAAIAGVAVFWSLLALATCVAVRTARSRKRRRRRMRDISGASSIDDSTAIQAAMMDAMIRAELARGRLNQPSARATNGSAPVQAPTYVNVAEMAAATPNGEFVRFFGEKFPDSLYGGSTAVTSTDALIPWWTYRPIDGIGNQRRTGRAERQHGNNFLAPTARLNQLQQPQQLRCPRPPPPPLLFDWRAASRQHHQLPAPTPMRCSIPCETAIASYQPPPPPPPPLSKFANGGGGIAFDVIKSNGCWATDSSDVSFLQSKVFADSAVQPTSMAKTDFQGLVASAKVKSLDSLAVFDSPSLDGRHYGGAPPEKTIAVDSRKYRHATGGSAMKRSASASRCSTTGSRRRTVTDDNIRLQNSTDGRTRGCRMSFDLKLNR